MTVIVTGVGFLGGYVVRDLLAAGEKVVLYGYLGGTGDPAGELPELDYIDRLTGGGLRDKVEVVVGDVCDLDAMVAAAERYDADAIAHFATMLGGSARERPWLSTNINVMGTANAFETAARTGMRKVVWTSSSGIFGPRSEAADGSVDDSSVPDPLGVYGAAKLMCEKLALGYAGKFGLNITGVRPTRVYGFGEHVKLTRGGGSSWLNDLLYRPAIGEGPSVVPFGQRALDFLYVEDVAAGLIKALGWQDPNGADSFLLSGDRRPIAEAVDFVRRLLPDAQITLDEHDLDPSQGATLAFSIKADSSRATSAFGFQARHSMEAGVFRTVNENRLLAGLDPIQEPVEARTAR
jgi:nucleoside-diphosphate-sugar epimerase